MPQRDRVLHNVKRSKLSCAVGGGSGQADALLATALRHAAGRAHLRVEAQQRAQPQECVLLLDVVADATQRGAPRAGQRGAGARVGGMGRRAPEGGEARCLGGSCLAAAAARAQLVARARTGTVEGRAVTVWAGSVERPAPIWPCNRGAAGRGRGSPGAQEGGGVRRQRLGAHPGDAAKRDGRVLNQAAWQRARGDLPGVGWGGAGGDGCAARLLHRFKPQGKHLQLRCASAQVSLGSTRRQQAGRQAQAHLQYCGQPLQSLQRKRLELVAAALDGQLACKQAEAAVRR